MATKKLKALAASGSDVKVIAIQTTTSMYELDNDSARNRRRADGKRLVEKNSLTEAHLIADRERAARALSGDDHDEVAKKKERRAANRLSAFQSRERRKVIIKELQERVAEVSQENDAQRMETDKLKVELAEVEKERDALRLQLQALQGKNTKSMVAASAPAHHRMFSTGVDAGHAASAVLSVKDLAQVSSSKNATTAPFKSFGNKPAVNEDFVAAKKYADLIGQTREKLMAAASSSASLTNNAPTRDLFTGLMGVQRQQAATSSENYTTTDPAAMSMSRFLPPSPQLPGSSHPNAALTAVQQQLLMLQQSLRSGHCR